MKSRGFTLIEMMATIAIISILTGVVLINYGDIRARAHLQDAETTMHTVRLAAELCVFRNANLNTPNSNTNPTNPTCAGSSEAWKNIAQLAPGWSYNTSDATFFEGDVSDREFTITAQDTRGNVITCTQAGCTTTSS